MKNKWMIWGIVGVMVLGMSACGRKETPEPESVQEASDIADTGVQDQAVSEQEIYIGIDALAIEEYVTLPDYRNMTVHVERPEITDEIIESYINSNHMLATQRAVEAGDIVDIDYVGKKDGVAFRGGTAEGYRLEIGAGGFIAGFEDGLIGVMPGETVDLNLTFPENYREPSLAGAPVVFTVTVNGIALSEQYADITDEQLAQLGVDKTREELWEAGEADAREAADAAYETNIQNAIMEELVRNCTFSSVPDYLVEEEQQSYNRYMESMCRNYYNVDLETFVNAYYGMTMEDYNSQIAQMCNDTIQGYIALEAVLRAERLEVTQEEINAKAAEEAEAYGYASGEELIEDVGYTTYRMYLVLPLVLERLSGMVTVEQ